METETSDQSLERWARLPFEKQAAVARRAGMTLDDVYASIAWLEKSGLTLNAATACVVRYIESVADGVRAAG